MQFVSHSICPYRASFRCLRESDNKQLNSLWCLNHCTSSKILFSMLPSARLLLSPRIIKKKMNFPFCRYREINLITNLLCLVTVYGLGTLLQERNEVSTFIPNLSCHTLELVMLIAQSSVLFDVLLSHNVCPGACPICKGNF